MIGTRELLEKQKKALEPERPVIPLLECPLRLTWTHESIETGLNLDETGRNFLLNNGRALNFMVAAWLGGQGFDLKADGTSGWFLVSQNNKATYRLRIVRDEVDLRPSKSKGMNRYDKASDRDKERQSVDGWAIVFMADLPSAPIWFFSESLVDLLQSKGLLDDKLKGKYLPIKNYFKEDVSEPQPIQ